MKEHLKRRSLILLALAIIVGVTSLFLYNASFNPSFSAIDLVTSASKKTRQKTKEASTENVADWKYTLDDLVLSEPENYEETEITANEKTYHLLKNIAKVSEEDNLIILSDKEDSFYQTAVQEIADALEQQGYQVTVKTYSKTMMLSLAHAGRFDIFLMSEEEQQ